MIELFAAATSNGVRAAIALEESGLAWRAVPVDLVAGEHRQPPYLAIGPTGRTPAIIDHDSPGSGFALSETLAIALYVARKSGAMLPSDPREAARMLQWCSVIMTDLNAAFRGMFVAQQIDRQRNAEQPAPMIARYRDEAGHHLAAIDRQAGDGPWICGDSFSVADVMLLPALTTSAPRFDLDLGRFTALAAWRERMLARPAVRAGLDLKTLLAARAPA